MGPIIESTIGVCAGSILFATATTFADCPDAGSGLHGVTTWAADNCAEGPCAGSATTCNGNFTVDLLDVDHDGSHVTFTWKVCQIGGQNGLSHFTIGLGQFDCLADGGSLSELLVGGSLDGEPVAVVLGLDPTTQVFGAKFDLGFAKDGCGEFALTLDASALALGKTIGVGCVLSATKAGNEDIRMDDRNSPGYACIAGPVCADDEVAFEGCSHGYWGNAPHADWDGTGHSRDTLIGSVFGPSAYADSTFEQALKFTGGPGVLGGQRILLRNAVASLLNASHPDVNYFFSEAEVIALVNGALATGNRGAMLDLEGDLDELNNLGGGLCD